MLTSSGTRWSCLWVAVACALVMGWLPGTANAVDWTGSPVMDVSAAGVDGFSPDVAVSADGTGAIAVWRCACPGGDVVQSRSATLSGGTATWGPITDLSPPGQVRSQPTVAISGDGTHATVVWEHFHTFTWVVQARSATITGTAAVWGPVDDLSEVGHEASDPQIALSQDGSRATAVWTLTYGLSDVAVQSRSATVYRADASWGQVSELSDPTQNALSPVLAMSTDGTRASVVWQIINGIGSDDPVQTASGAIDGTTAVWGAVTALSAPGVDGDAPRIAVSGDGTRATAAWRSAPDAGLLARSATIAGTSASWGPVEVLADADCGAPAIGVSSDGTRVTAVWARNWEMQSRSATVDGAVSTWGPVTGVPSAGAKSVSPVLGLSADGSRATALWRRGYGSVLVVQSASATVAGLTSTWTPAVDLSDPNVDAADADLGTSADGLRSLAVWTRSNASFLVLAKMATAQSQTIDFTAPPDTQLDQGPVALAATSSSGLPVSFASGTPAVCTVAGAVATLVATGTCTVTGSQPGNGLVAPAPDVSRSFLVSTPPQNAVTPPNPPNDAASVPGRVPSVSAKAKRKGKVIIRWSRPTGDVSTYRVQRSTNKRKWIGVATTNARKITEVWKKPGTRYYVRVAGSNTVGRGPWSRLARVRVR